MVIGKKINDAMNRQLNRELYSGYMYLGMAAYFDCINLKGFAHWMRVQAGEEKGHAMKFYHYINERTGKVVLQEIEAPPAKWKSPLDAFKHTYEHEQVVTGLINDLVKAARSENDYASETFLHWFLDEQVEEEASALEIVEKLKMIGDSPASLLMLDHHLGERK